MIYLDYNATTPVDPQVANEMRPFLDQYFGNPSSSHEYGLKTKLAIEDARLKIAKMINAKSSEIIFTSGGTESNNYALKGIAFAHKEKGNHIITTSVEHPAIIEVCKFLETHGFEVTYLSVDEYGIIDIKELERSITDKTILITVMHANNEVGSIQPIKLIGELAQKHQIVFHSDAAQSIGKLKMDVEEMKLDLLSIAGHKLYAPKGIGALYIRRGTILEKQMHGADHEQNRRAGTENVLEIVGLGKAAALISQNLELYQNHYAEKRDLLYGLLKEAFPNIRRNGHQELCLPNTLSISFPNKEANVLISKLKNVAVSAGAAYHSEGVEVSAVLKAMAIPIEFAMVTIRFSTGRSTSDEDIKNVVEELKKALK